jgi:hypothetical protein
MIHFEAVSENNVITSVVVYNDDVQIGEIKNDLFHVNAVEVLANLTSADLKDIIAEMESHDVNVA